MFLKYPVCSFEPTKKGANDFYKIVLSLLKLNQMIVVGCNYCGLTEPLVCGGTYFPHIPMQAIFNPIYGCVCPYCGPKPPIYTCSYCRQMQYIIFQGAQINQTAFMQSGVNRIAPAVETNNASLGSILLKEFTKSAAKNAGGIFGDFVANSFEGFFTSDDNNY